MDHTKTRIIWIDQLRSIAFLFVILGHVAVTKDVQSWIYSFHMPLFFLISGLTINREKLINASFKDYLIKQAKALIVPYFWLNFLMFPLWYVTFKVISPVKTTIYETFVGIFAGKLGVNMPSNALWFLLVLFLANILYAWLLKLSKGHEALLFLCVVSCGIIGYLDNAFDQLWHFNIVFTAVVLLYIGNRFMIFYKGSWLLNAKRNGSFVFKIIGLIVLFALIGWCSHINNGRISMTANKFGKSVLLFYITAIAFSAVMMLIVMFLPKLRFVTYIGQVTLFYMGVHIPIIRLFEKTFPSIFSQPRYAVLLAVVLYFALAPLVALCKKIIPYSCSKPSDGSKMSQMIFRVLAVMWCLSIPVFALLGKFGFTIRVITNDIIFVILLAVISTAFVLITSRFCPVIYLDTKRPKKTIDKR